MVNEEHTRWLAGHSLFRFLQQSTCSYVFVCLKGQKQTKEKLRHSTIQQSRRKLVFCIGCLQILLLHILLHAGNQQINFVHDYRNLQLWRSNCSSFFQFQERKNSYHNNCSGWGDKCNPNQYDSRIHIFDVSEITLPIKQVVMQHELIEQP